MIHVHIPLPTNAPFMLSPLFVHPTQTPTSFPNTVSLPPASKALCECWCCSRTTHCIFQNSVFSQCGVGFWRGLYDLAVEMPLSSHLFEYLLPPREPALLWMILPLQYLTYTNINFYSALPPQASLCSSAALTTVDILLAPSALCSHSSIPAPGCSASWEQPGWHPPQFICLFWVTSFTHSLMSQFTILCLSSTTGELYPCSFHVQPQHYPFQPGIEIMPPTSFQILCKADVPHGHSHPPSSRTPSHFCSFPCCRGREYRSDFEKWFSFKGF